jgi:hypothetical protein
MRLNARFQTQAQYKNTEIVSGVCTQRAVWQRSLFRKQSLCITDVNEGTIVLSTTSWSCTWCKYSRLHQHHLRNIPFRVKDHLRIFCQICLVLTICRTSDHPVFTFLDFAIIFSFAQQGHQPCVQPPTWRARSLYLCPKVSAWPSFTSRHRAPFPSPPTPRGATMQAFLWAATRESHLQNVRTHHEISWQILRQNFSLIKFRVTYNFRGKRNVYRVNYSSIRMSSRDTFVYKKLSLCLTN